MDLRYCYFFICRRYVWLLFTSYVKSIVIPAAKHPTTKYLVAF